MIHPGALNRDCVHLLATIPPHLSVSRAPQHLRGRNSTRLLQEYASLRKEYWGQHLREQYIENEEVETSARFKAI